MAPVRIAIIADTHIAPPDTPGFASNVLLADRSRFVVAEINRLQPDLVVHLGDVVHPLPSDLAHRDAVGLAVEIFSELEAPLCVVPGNHDVGDKPRSLVAVPPVTDAAYPVFEAAWGPAYRTVEIGGLHLVFIDTPVLNSGLAREQEQIAWLHEQLPDAGETRSFLFGHYPPYLVHPDEPEHYDNLAEPARSRLLELMERHGVEAAFFGHVHHGFLNLGPTRMHVAPAIGFTRPDYTELAHIGAGDEFGRNERAKLGFLILDIDERGHSVTTVRTYGSTGEPLPVPARLLVDPKRPSPLGVTLRTAWNETVSMPTDGLDEFRRKTVRNDDIVLALFEGRITRVLVPIADLHDDPDRVFELVLAGLHVDVLTTDVPDARTLREIEGAAVDRVVVALPPEEIGSFPDLSATAPDIVSVAVSPIVPYRPGEHHFVSHGFAIDDPLLDEVSGVDEVVFRCPPGASPWTVVEAAADRARRLGARAIVNVQTPRAGETVLFDDDNAVARVVAEATVAAMSHPGVTVYLDTFVDHDRGYYPRHGLLDRRFDPRPAFHLLCNLTGRLPEGRWERQAPDRFVHASGAVLMLDGSEDQAVVQLAKNEKAPVLVIP